MDRAEWRMDSIRYEVMREEGADATIKLDEGLKQQLERMSTILDSAEERLAKKMEQQEELMKTTLVEHRSEVETLREFILQSVCQNGRDVASRAEGSTYAQILKRKSSIILKSKDAEQPPRDLRNILNKEVKIATLPKINCRQTKAGNIVLSSQDENEIIKLQQQLESNDKITSKIEIDKIQPKRQKVIIFNAPCINVVEDEENNESLDEENRRKVYAETILKPALLKALKTKPLDFQIQRIISLPRNKDTNHLVIDLPRDYSTQLLNTLVYVGFNRCNVRKFINIPRCFCCQGFGHIARNCDKRDIVPNVQAHTTPKIAKQQKNAVSIVKH